MYSKKRLFKDLEVLGFEQPSLYAPYISNETYGRNSFVYVGCGDVGELLLP